MLLLPLLLVLLLLPLPLLLLLHAMITLSLAVAAQLIRFIAPHSCPNCSASGILAAANITTLHTYAD